MNKIYLKSIYLNFLIQGQKIDWKYSLVVIFIITGLISTPFIFGSIRNNAYEVHVQQMEKEYNVREISILNQNEKQVLDDTVKGKVIANFPAVKVIGNTKRYVRVIGSNRAVYLTANIITINDPRSDNLQIQGGTPKNFGIRDIIISDDLGRLLYGKKLWDKSWVNNKFNGEPLSIEFAEVLLSGKFNVVARQKKLGRAIYLHPLAGKELRQYSNGYGAPSFNLPPNPELVQLGLPKIKSLSCLITFPDTSTCPEDKQNKLLQRLVDHHHEVNTQGDFLPILTKNRYSQKSIFLKTIISSDSDIKIKSITGDCSSFLDSHVFSYCKDAIITPEFQFNIGMDNETVKLIGVNAEVAEVLLKDLNKNKKEKLFSNETFINKGYIPIISGDKTSLEKGQTINFTIRDEKIRGEVISKYNCKADNCPFLMPTKSIFRLINISDGLISISSRSPVIFQPIRLENEYDEILVYAPSIDKVKIISNQLTEFLGDNYSISYQKHNIIKLERDNERLTKLFHVTMISAIIFLVISLGSLSVINIERRRRQIAQMLILGFSRAFIKRLIIGEYLLLTTIASLFSVAISWGLFTSLRFILSSNTDDKNSEQMIQAMNIDFNAFVTVFGVAILSTLLVAFLSANHASKTDPVNLLD